MVWVLVDVAIVLGALVVLGLVCLGLWQRIKALGRAFGVAGTQMAGLTDQLDRLSAGREPAPAATTFTRTAPGRHVSQAPRTPPGVGSTRSPEGGTS